LKTPGIWTSLTRMNLACVVSKFLLDSDVSFKSKIMTIGGS